MRYAAAVLLALFPLASHADFVSLETALEGLYPVAAGQCDLEVANANLKLNQEPCDLARREGDDEHVGVDQRRRAARRARPDRARNQRRTGQPE